jgi:dUTP pyrophosphatase
MSLQIKLLTSDAKVPIRQTKDSAGYDLYSSEPGEIKAGQRLMVNTGIAIKMPGITGMSIYGKILSRSGLSAKYGIEAGAGVIDSDYRGEIKVILYNHSNKDFKFDKHERIAQLVMHLIATPNTEIVKDLDNTERGFSGFGSTGTK